MGYLSESVRRAPLALFRMNAVHCDYKPNVGVHISFDRTMWHRVKDDHNMAQQAYEDTCGEHVSGVDDDNEAGKEDDE